MQGGVVMLARKLVALGATVFLSAGLFAAAAHSTVPKVDVSHDTVKCTSVYGSATFSPGLQTSPLPPIKPSKVAIKGVVGDCTVTGPNPAVVVSGTFAGTLVLENDTATGLLGLESATGTLSIKWKADKTTPLLQTSTVLTPNAICGGTTQIPKPLNDFYALFHFGAQANCGDEAQPASSATGAFAGDDHGAASVTDAVTVQTIASLIPKIGGPPGVTGVNIALGTLTIG
jgi:hypothetical protein